MVHPPADAIVLDVDLASLVTTFRKTQLGRRASHLTIATTMYREMDMRLWLEQAETEMGV